MDDKTKKAVNMFILWLFNRFALFVFFIMISVLAFAIPHILTKKNKAKTTTPDDKLKSDNKVDYVVLKDQDWDIIWAKINLKQQIRELAGIFCFVSRRLFLDG